MTVICSENLTSTSQTKEHRALVMIYTTDHSVRLETMAMIMMTNDNGSYSFQVPTHTGHFII